MSRSEQEDDWIDEVQHREGFVLDEAHFRCLIGPLLWRPQAEDVFAPPPSGKVVFTTSPATLQDLEDGSTVLGLGPMQDKPKDSGFDAGSREGETSSKSQVFVPTGEVPDAQEVGYRQVNPMFESCESPEVIFRSLHKAMRTQDVEFSCSPDWAVRCRLSRLPQPFSYGG
ncbi:unnamed protein product [Phytophthora lilii]|uniref:Unnamed protein product n=1 Tax=Phytophthora lilii TaxID=2077276 RepID=A0A9W6TCS3_9STRA|nr:unnamed protein product [Phytophthora lilii]